MLLLCARSDLIQQLMREARAKGCPNCKALAAKADLLDAIRRDAEAAGIWGETEALGKDNASDR